MTDWSGIDDEIMAIVARQERGSDPVWRTIILLLLVPVRGSALDREMRKERPEWWALDSTLREKVVKQRIGVLVALNRLEVSNMEEIGLSMRRVEPAYTTVNPLDAIVRACESR